MFTTVLILFGQSLIAAENTDKTVPYHDDFESMTEADDAPEGWTYSTEMEADCGFGAFSSVRPHSGNFYFYSNPKYTASDAWAFSPRVEMKAGVTYVVSAYVNAPGYNGIKDELRITAGNAPTKEGQTTVVIDKTGDKAEAFSKWTRIYATFTPETDGFYHFGLNHCTQEIDVNGVCFDDFAIEELGKETPAAKTYMTGGLWSTTKENTVYLMEDSRLSFGISDLYADSFEWTAPSAQPETSTEKTFEITYAESGSYEVSLTAEKDGNNVNTNHSFNVEVPEEGTRDVVSNIIGEPLTSVSLDYNEYLSGANSHYSAFAEKYTLPADRKATVKGIKFTVVRYKADAANKRQEAFIKIYDTNEQGLPGNELFSQKMTVEELFGTAPIITETPINIEFSQEVNTVGSFFVSIDIPTFYPSGKSFYAIGSTFERDYNYCTSYAYYEKAWLPLSEIFTNGFYSFAMMPDIVFKERLSSTATLNNDNVKIYPTIISNQVNIEAEIGSQIRIFDIAGKTVFTTTTTTSVTTVSMSSFNGGMYLVQVTDSNGKIALAKIAKR